MEGSPGTRVTINGEKFPEDTANIKVIFNSENATIISSCDTIIECIVPKITEGKAYIAILINDSTGYVTKAFTVISSGILGNWIEKDDFGGFPRTGAISFSIGDTAYIGTGYDGENYLNDLWQYNHENDYWKQVAYMPGGGRTETVAFGTRTHGYIGTGFSGSIYLDDIWKFEPFEEADMEN